MRLSLLVFQNNIQNAALNNNKLYGATTKHTASKQYFLFNLKVVNNKYN